MIHDTDDTVGMVSRAAKGLVELIRLQHDAGDNIASPSHKSRILGHHQGNVGLECVWIQDGECWNIFGGQSQDCRTIPVHLRGFRSVAVIDVHVHLRGKTGLEGGDDMLGTHEVDEEIRKVGVWKTAEIGVDLIGLIPIISTRVGIGVCKVANRCVLQNLPRGRRHDGEPGVRNTGELSEAVVV